jgi:hypothetical protein
VLSLLRRAILRSHTEQIIASNWMCRAAIGWRLVPIEYAVITQHGSNAKPVVAKDASAALGLNGAMHLYIAPSFERSFIAPEGQRKQFVRMGQAAKALNRDEAIHFLKVRTKLCGLALGDPDRDQQS